MSARAARSTCPERKANGQAACSQHSKEKGRPTVPPFPFTQPIVQTSLRGELDVRRGGADVGVDLGFELGKILLEHADQRAGGLVELSLVGPGLDRIEDM